MSDDIREAAEAASAFFTASERGDETITVLADGAPEWVRDLVREAHGDFLPDDWRYTAIRSAVDALADGSDPDEGGEWADSNVDVYNGARLSWLSSHLSRAGYCDEGVDELGGADLDTFERIGLGQYMELSEIWSLVVQSLRQHAEVNA